VSGAQGGLLLLIMVAILAATMIVGTVKWLQLRREHQDRVTRENDHHR
jgi:sensor domain CHASE-containing protein